MAIESAALLRRCARTECLVLLLVLVWCATVVAQAPALPAVTSSSAIGVPHPQWGQIYKIVVSSQGHVVFVDDENGALYELMNDGTTVVTLAAKNTVLRSWSASGMAIDGNDNIYISDTWNGKVVFRVPYDAESGTWKLTALNAWGTELGYNTLELAWDAANNHLILSTSPDRCIYRIPVNANGTPGPPILVVKSLKARASKMAVDQAGNIYFIEDPWLYASDNTAAVPGVMMIPAGTHDVDALGDGREATLFTRVDPNMGDWKGLAVDAAGNLYISNELDSHVGGSGMVVMVPNEGGTLNKNHAVMVAPVVGTGAMTIDPRGFLWIPTSTGGWNQFSNSLNFVKLAPGSVNAGTSPVGTQGATALVFFSFSGTTTVADITVSQPGGGSDFVIVPDAAPKGVTAQCAKGTTYHAFDRCAVGVALQAHVPGGVSGKVQLLDGSGTVLGSAYVHGVGQGPGLSVLVPSQQTAIGTGWSTPKQVAADALGNVYVADAGLAQVLQYPAGGGNAVSIGTGLTAPTGVAVDGAGTVYIGDAGKVIKVNAAGQTAIQSGLGTALNLAVDGGGNVFAADPDNHRVVRVANPDAALQLPNQTATVGSGFNQPTAVAVDGAGNLFVADGANLFELPVLGLQTAITNQLSSAVALAADASGSIYVAQSTGLIRIPKMPDGSFSFNDAVLLGGNTITAPVSVATGTDGSLYVSTGSGVTQLSRNGALHFNDFGPVLPDVEADVQAQLFNVGNQPLTFSSLSGFPITGPNAAEFQVVAPADSPACDPANPTAAGWFCWLGVGVTPADVGTRTASIAIQSDAANAASVTLGVSANAVADTRPATQTAIGISPSQPVYPANVTITVTVGLVGGGSTPQGTVTLTLTGQPQVSKDLENGVATFAFTSLKGGTYRVKAVYGGSGEEFAISAASSQFTVNPAPSSTALSTPPTYVKVNTGYILTATVTAAAGTPTGKVSFMEGSQPADPTQPTATLDATGKATFNTNNLALGTHTIKAVYAGDTNFAGSTAATVTFQIVNPSVLIGANPTAITVTPGIPQSTNLTLTSIVGYENTNNWVSLACVNVPQYSECTFDHPLVAMTADGTPSKVVVTLSTNVPVNVGTAKLAPSAPWIFPGVFAVGLVGLVLGGKSKRGGRVLLMLCAVLLITGAVGGITACGNSGYSRTPPAPHVTTPAGTYNVTVTATETDTRQLKSLPFTFSVTVK